MFWYSVLGLFTLTLVDWKSDKPAPLWAQLLAIAFWPLVLGCFVREVLDFLTNGRCPK